MSLRLSVVGLLGLTFASGCEDVPPVSASYPRCNTALLWAKQTGIVNDAAYYKDYPFLNSASSLEDFQLALFLMTKNKIKGDGQDCVFPCSASPQALYATQQKLQAAKDLDPPSVDMDVVSKGVSSYEQTMAAASMTKNGVITSGPTPTPTQSPTPTPTQSPTPTIVTVTTTTSAGSSGSLDSSGSGSSSASSASLGSLASSGSGDSSGSLGSLASSGSGDSSGSLGSLSSSDSGSGDASASSETSSGGSSASSADWAWWAWLLLALAICCLLPLLCLACAAMLCYEQVAWIFGGKKSKRAVKKRTSSKVPASPQAPSVSYTAPAPQQAVPTVMSAVPMYTAAPAVSYTAPAVPMTYSAPVPMTYVPTPAYTQQPVQFAQPQYVQPNNQIFSMLDRDGDGRISREEFAALMRR